MAASESLAHFTANNLPNGKNPMEYPQAIQFILM